MKFAFKNALLFAAFIVIGTLSHECGHYIVARFVFGYEHARIAYDKTILGAIPTGLTPANYRKANILITLGGPLLTVTIGTIGLLFCLCNKAYKTFNWRLHLYLMLTLFWART